VRNWLVILLGAPLASFGEEPGNVRRGSAVHPTRSALVGLAGAALGLDRADIDGQRHLSQAFLTATRTIKAGTPLRDFHTFQSLPSPKGSVATRAQALARKADLVTSITVRDYRSDGMWQAAYCEREGALVSLAALRDAFKRPRYALYVGRRSCPPGYPLAPAIVDAPDPATAFVWHAKYVNTQMRESLIAEADGVIAADSRVFATDAQHANAVRRIHRNDEPGDRTRWQFTARFEHVYTMPLADGDGS
jgi:CRISPR system Cascade subunit CasD